MFWFRVLSDGEPTGHIGIVAAKDTEHLYWAIDELCDPWQVELMPVQCGGMLVRRPFLAEAEEGAEDEELESGSEMPFPDDDGEWIKPDWSHVPYAGLNGQMEDAPWA